MNELLYMECPPPAELGATDSAELIQRARKSPAG
jgi:hypothetical protein